MTTLTLRDLGFIAAGQAAAGGTWTPAQTTTALWLDAGDATTITTVSGAVSQWNDKSGNTRTATQSTAGSRPAYTASGQNGLGVLSFNGTSSFLDIASTALFTSGNADLAIFAAYKNKFPSTSGAGALFGNYTGSNGLFSVYFGGVPGAYFTPWGIYSNSSVDMDSGSHTQNANYLISAVRSGGSFTGWTNGTTQNTVANSNSVYGAGVTSSSWRVGNSYVSSEFGNMDLYELICMNSAPSTTVRQQVEGYLAWKWGLTASLPSGHPYKNAAP